jgi:chromosome partitioning protein
LRIIAIANQKGGVGKTTSTVNIGAALAQHGKRVLLIDIDPQGSLSASVGITEPELTIYQLLQGEADVSQVMQQVGPYYVIPAGLDLSGAELEFSSMAGRELLLREAIEPYQAHFDYILIDCPPSLGILTLNAFTAATEVFIPMQTEFLSLQGVSMLTRSIEVVRKRLNHRLEITGVIGTLYDGRKRLNREVVETIQEHLGGKLFDTCIRDNVSLAEAPSFGLDIFQYKPKSYGARDYMTLSREIIKRGEIDER